MDKLMDMSKDGPLLAVTNDIIAYLSEHELDIAQEVGDYGDLSRVFLAFFGRKPRGNPHVTPIAYAIKQASN